MNDSPAVILYDAYGNEIFLADGYDITVNTKGIPIIIINDNYEAKFARGDTDGYMFSTARINEPLPSGYNIIGKIGVDSNNTGGLALDSTLIDAYNKLEELENKDFSTETTLSSIKDTDGIKKITDSLPSGTNTIGNIILKDEYGHFIDSINTDGYNRLTVNTRIAGGSSRVINTSINDEEISTSKVGNILHLISRDSEQIALLKDIKDELKIIRKHIKLITD